MKVTLDGNHKIYFSSFSLQYLFYSAEDIDLESFGKKKKKKKTPLNLDDLGEALPEDNVRNQPSLAYGHPKLTLLYFFQDDLDLESFGKKKKKKKRAGGDLGGEDAASENKENGKIFGIFSTIICFNTNNLTNPYLWPNSRRNRTKVGRRRW